MGNDDSVERSRRVREKDAFSTESIMQEAGKLPEEPTLEHRIEILESQVRSLLQNINLLTDKQVEYYNILNTLKKGIEKTDKLPYDDMGTGIPENVKFATPYWGDPKNSRKRKKE